MFASTSVTSFKGAVLRRLRQLGVEIQAIEPQMDRDDRVPLNREALSALFELENVDLLHKPNALRRSEVKEHSALNDMRDALYAE